MKNISAVSDSKDIVTVEYIDNITASADASNAITINHSVSYPLLSLKAYGRSWQGERIVNVSDIGIEGYGIPVDTGGNYTDKNGQQWVCDELVVNADGTGKIIKSCRKFDCKSNDRWLESSKLTGRYVHEHYCLANVTPICPYFKGKAHGPDKDSIEPNIVFNNQGVQLCFNTKFSSLDEWLAFLDTVDLYVYEALATTEETELTSEQLTALQPVIDRYGAFTAYFMSAQDGTPTPENPVEIVSTADLHRVSVPFESIGDSGSLTVTTYGKNLFDFEAWKNDVNKVNNGTSELFDNGLGITSADSLASSSECYTISKTFLYYGSGPIKTNSSETYTLSWSVSGDVSNGRVRIFSNGVSPSLAYSNSSSRKRTFTTPSDCEFITIRLEVSAAASTVVFSDIQLEKGETATDYEPFRSVSAEITTGLPMRGIPVSNGGNYTDENGQEWVCDSIEYDYTTAVKHHRIAVIDSYNGETVGDNYISTTGGLDVGATIIYSAENVTETALTADEINQLRSLVTFDGTTSINNGENADMAVEYLTSKAVSKAVMPIITALRSDVNA